MKADTIEGLKITWAKLTELIPIYFNYVSTAFEFRERDDK
jgi:hypothetical protein